MPRRPDFFLVGAPKCGTTALSEYLRTHPAVFFSDPKEPQFFCDDFRLLRPEHRRLASLDEYLELFREAGPAHRAVGEGSTWYLYSEVALHRIREFAPDARILAMVRNPVDLVASWHAQLLLMWEESVEDFPAAFALGRARREGRDIPETCTVPPLLDYAAVGRLGSQVERLLATFPAAQVKVVVFDDFVADTAAVYADVLAFLGLPHDGRKEFPRVNPNEVHASRALARADWAVGNLGRIGPLRRIVRAGKKAMGLEGRRLLKVPKGAHTRPESRRPMEPEFRDRLATLFRDDVELLGRILGRDLSHWR